MKGENRKGRTIVYTIGHSTRSAADFLELLKIYKIKKVADIRTIPKSRHNPQFNKDSIGGFLEENGIEYAHMPGLGGLRKPRKDSPNTAWKNDSFRGFADYMQTEEFEEAIKSLIGMAIKKTTVIMCGEAVPWRCHRSLVGDALLARDIEVEDIISRTSCRPHNMTPWAKVRGGKIIYPSE